MKKPIDHEELARELASLPGLDRAALLDRWRDLYNNEPPAYISKPLLVRALAYRLQENAFGGLKPATKRLLIKIAEGAAPAQAPARSTRSLKPGTRLLRDWRGVTHEVIVVDDGVLFRGERYRSLSEVARAITGTPWSGPRFFGLHAVRKGTTP